MVRVQVRPNGRGLHEHLTHSQLSFPFSTPTSEFCPHMIPSHFSPLHTCTTTAARHSPVDFAVPVNPTCECACARVHGQSWYFPPPKRVGHCVCARTSSGSYFAGGRCAFKVARVTLIARVATITAGRNPQYGRRSIAVMPQRAELLWSAQAQPTSAPLCVLDKQSHCTQCSAACDA